LEAGDEVVTRANFLIDAESNLKSALDSFKSPADETDKPVPEVQPEGH
jgi:Cu(I)/Ag(I) efflux system membrane fusion protein